MDTRMKRDISDRFRRPAVTLLVLGLVAASALADIPEDSPVADALRRAEASVVDIVDVSADRRTLDNTIWKRAVLSAEPMTTFAVRSMRAS